MPHPSRWRSRPSPIGTPTSSTSGPCSAVWPATWAHGPSPLDPPKHSLFPGVHQAEQEHEHEYAHLYEAETGVDLEASGPRKDEDRFDVEHHEKEGEDVVPDLALCPTVADWIDTRLVRHQFVRGVALGSHQRAQCQNSGGQGYGNETEDGEGEVVTKVLRHSASRLPGARLRTETHRQPIANPSPAGTFWCREGALVACDRSQFTHGPYDRRP